MKKEIVLSLFLFFFWMNVNATTASLSFEEQVIVLVNKERKDRGLSALESHDKLTAIAQTKLEDMVEHRYFDHISPTYGAPFRMIKKLGIHCSIAGENIARGQQTPQDVMEDWMNSESHRRNILYEHYEKIGVAYENGLWVQLFVK